MSSNEPSLQPVIDADGTVEADAEPRDILVVDDDATNLTAIEVALGDLGRRLVKASSGREALRHMLHQDFALILLDVHMPQMDGFETARLIRSRRRSEHVPIIFVTAYNRDDQDVLRGYELGAVDFLFKPIVPEILRAKASVFVTLQERKLEVERQAEQLRELERREHAQQLAEERRRWETERLRTENRRKDEFLAILAHELRNPLASVAAGLELMKADKADADDWLAARGAMERQVGHLVRLVDDLLDVARISQGKIALVKRRCDLREAIGQAVDDLRMTTGEEDHTIEAELPGDGIEVFGDELRLVQIATNLLHNAVRYTPTGGRVHIGLCREGDEAVLRVTDNGRGIEAEMLERIFDLFAQERSDGEGLGLGLTVVHRLVEMHEGHIEVKSDGQGKGAQFVVRLPLMAPATQHAPPPEAKSAAAVTSDSTDGRGLRVALVDDEDDVRELMGKLLRRWGHEVEIAADGQSGIDLVVRTRPDIVLMDVGMPGVDGYEAARRIRDALGDKTPQLIAVTGFGGARYRKRAQEAGFDDHLVKPAHPDKLRQVLQGRRDD